MRIAARNQAGACSCTQGVSEGWAHRGTSGHIFNHLQLLQSPISLIQSNSVQFSLCILIPVEIVPCQAPINGATARHQQLMGQIHQGRRLNALRFIGFVWVLHGPPISSMQ